MNLLEHRKSKYSSIGNDGIIEHIFKILGKSSGFFVEFGAWDGIKGSNCRKLWEEGWKGIFIEGDQNKYLQLVKNYKPDSLNWPWYDKKYVFKDVVCINEYVDLDKNKFDNLVKDHIPSSGIDFCSIDIDGLDVEIFETFQNFYPSVICIEGGQMLHPFHERIEKKKAKNNIQQSLSVMVDTFSKKGYRLLCTYQDSFFIKEELYDDFEISENLMELYFNGLAAHARRIPWIQMKLSQVGLKNSIVDKILDSTNYSSYNYSHRKRWIQEQNDLILEKILEIRSTHEVY